MPKDHESVPLPALLSDEMEGGPSPQPFAPDQLVRCDNCLRANPPTRLRCLYCGSGLPITEEAANFKKPTLRPLDKWERGYNNILLPPPANLTADQLAQAADVLKLTTGDLERIMARAMPLPLARTATTDDASIIKSRLARLQIDTQVVSDEQLGIDETQVIKVRAMEIDEASMSAYQTPESPPLKLPWADFALIVLGRLITRRIELKEQKTRGTENRITDSSEFVTDEAVIDLYVGNESVSYRIAANSFDFSCLGAEKGLLAAENISKLVKFLKHRLPDVVFDDTYNSLRKTLEVVWASEQRNESRGLHRQLPGRVSIGSATETSNDSQFLRYSRLRYFLRSQNLKR